MPNRTRRFFALVLFVLTTNATIYAAPRETREPRDRTSIIRRVIARVRGFLPTTQEDTLSIPHP